MRTMNACEGPRLYQNMSTGKRRSKRPGGHLPSEGHRAPTSATHHFQKFSTHDFLRWNLLLSNRLLPKLTTAIVLLMATTSTDGTCNEEQIETCRESALDGKLSSLRSGGQCSPRRYAEFSHLCSVSNYLPTVEYCCCVYETSVLCCRYHQGWNIFRCQMEEDIIDTTSGIVDHLNDDAGESSLCCPPLEFLLPVVLVPLFVIVCCLYVCLKYRKHGITDGLCSFRSDDDDVTSVSPRKNRKNNDGEALGLSSSLTSSDANSILPLTRNGQAPATAEKTSLYAQTDSPAGAGATAGQGTSLVDDSDPYFSDMHLFYPPTIEPSAPPLCDGLDPEATSPCAFSYHDPSDQNYEEYCGTRFRDAGGRLRPLYRAPRSNFSSSGRCSVPGLLVHRPNIGEGHHCHRPSNYDRCATYRMAEQYPIRACNGSPPPPSYEQSCHQNS